MRRGAVPTDACPPPPPLNVPHSAAGVDNDTERVLLLALARIKKAPTLTELMRKKSPSVWAAHSLPYADCSHFIMRCFENGTLMFDSSGNEVAPDVKLYNYTVRGSELGLMRALERQGCTSRGETI